MNPEEQDEIELERCYCRSCGRRLQCEHDEEEHRALLCEDCG